MTDPAVLTERDGAVWTLTFNRPQRRNAFDLADRLEFGAALSSAEESSDCRAVVLVGAGGFFSAGGDIRSMTQDPEAAGERLRIVADIARSIVQSSKPFVAAVEGGAFGLGLALAASCDYVVAANTARFGASFGRIGLIGDTGIHWSLSQRIGPARAKEMLLMSSELRCERAHELGLVSEVVDESTALTIAVKRARTVARSAPGSIAGTKRIFAQPKQDLDAILASESQIQIQLLASSDFAEGRRAFFERRAAVFEGS